MGNDVAGPTPASKPGRQNTKQLVYEVALELFAARSYAGTSLRDIAARVGIEVASLYAHIPGKNALLFDLMDIGTRDLLQRLENSVATVEGKPVAQLYVLVRDHVATNCRRQQQTLVAYNEIRELNAEQRQVILPLREKITSLYTDRVERGIESGLLRKQIDVRLAVYGIVSLGRGVATWYRADGPLSPEELGEMYADQVLRGLLTAEWLAKLGDEPIRLAALSADDRPVRAPREKARPARGREGRDESARAKRAGRARP